MYLGRSGHWGSVNPKAGANRALNGVCYVVGDGAMRRAEAEKCRGKTYPPA